MHDVVIRGGTVVDGTGAKPRIADVAIENGLIVDVGRSALARRVVDADGALVTPGWVDPHTHYDGQVTWDDRLEGSAANGVTTVVMGNCGVGFAPVRPGQADALIDLMEGVEDIPGTALFEGMPWGEWETFPEYLAFLDQRSWALDVGAQLAHGALRYYVMGDRAIRQLPAESADLDHMAVLAEEAVRAGALGFSTSRILAHRAMSGYQVPGTFATEDELTVIARAMGAGGGATLQAIPASAIGEYPGLGAEQAPVLEEVAMLGRLSRMFGLQVTFTTLQTAGAPEDWRLILATVAEENDRGAKLAPMIAPRGATVLTTLLGYHLFMQRPSYRRLKHLPLEKLVAELRRPDVKRAILAEGDVLEGRPGAMENVLPPALRQALPLTFPLTDPVDYEPTLESSLAAQASAQGVTGEEYLYDFLLGDGGKAVGVYFGANYVGGNLDVCREMLLDPYTVSGLSDAGAHSNFICDMSAPTFHLTHWARDRARGEGLPIEAVVAKATAFPARTFGLNDRGTVEPGKRADVNVIDLDRLTIKRPELRRDLPAGGQRFVQLATGYVATFVAGHQTREHDLDTGARPGRIARRPKS